ncbi:MAG: multidrug ABC transporter [Eubacteriales bacterium]|nr:multidrug ABC transporter [Eubacteriales bacterium]
MSNYIYIGAFLILVLASSVSQILLKTSANENREGIGIFLNYKVMIAYGILFSAMVLIAMLYRFIPLSTGTLLESASFVFVPALSCLILKERMAARQKVGVVFILFGIIIVAFF